MSASRSRSPNRSQPADSGKTGAELLEALTSSTPPRKSFWEARALLMLTPDEDAQPANGDDEPDDATIAPTLPLSNGDDEPDNATMASTV